jgi:hypothetical protein
LPSGDITPIPVITTLSIVYLPLQISCCDYLVIFFILLQVVVYYSIINTTITTWQGERQDEPPNEASSAIGFFKDPTSQDCP